MNGGGRLGWKYSRGGPCGRGYCGPGRDGDGALEGSGGVREGPATAVLCSHRRMGYVLRWGDNCSDFCFHALIRSRSRQWGRASKRFQKWWEEAGWICGRCRWCDQLTLAEWIGAFVTISDFVAINITTAAMFWLPLVSVQLVQH